AARVRSPGAAAGARAGAPALAGGALMAARPSAGSGNHSDLLLVALTFGSGAVDAISFLGLGRVFTANMTGNIVILGLAVGIRAGAEVVRAATSLVAFTLGVLIASRLAHRFTSGASWSSGVR